jgi:hypothetical protein
MPFCHDARFSSFRFFAISMPRWLASFDMPPTLLPFSLSMPALPLFH